MVQHPLLEVSADPHKLMELGWMWKRRQLTSQICSCLIENCLGPRALSGSSYLDPQEDAEIPWWAVQDAVGQVAAARILRLPILPLALAFSVGTGHTVDPLRRQGKSMCDTLGESYDTS